MTRLNHVRTLALISSLAVAGLLGCTATPTPKTQADANSLHTEVQSTVGEYRARDPGIDRFFRESAGYVIFPRINSAAVGIGGSYGKGEVYQQGKGMIGFADISKANIGVQLGGQEYSEIVFFKDAGALADFTSGKTTFDAKASAVAADAGASAAASYNNGVVVFTYSKGGLMAQAAIGGQTFKFTPSMDSEIRPNNMATDHP